MSEQLTLWDMTPDQDPQLLNKQIKDIQNKLDDLRKNKDAVLKELETARESLARANAFNSHWQKHYAALWEGLAPNYQELIGRAAASQVAIAQVNTVSLAVGDDDIVTVTLPALSITAPLIKA